MLDPWDSISVDGVFTLAVAYPCHLYIRVDRELRAALLAAASDRSRSVSDVARQYLSDGLERATGTKIPLLSKARCVEQPQT